MTGPIVVAISSHVARGSVGNRAMVFALERLGFTVWAIPTVVLAHHPGHGPSERIVGDDSSFAGLLRKLTADGRAGEVSGIVSGYLATPAQAEAVADFVRTVKLANPDALYLCDPVIGDQGGLYVPPPLAGAIRDQLMPLADMAAPNAFECAWLANGSANREPELGQVAGLACSLGSAATLVTSAPALMRGGVGNLLSEDGIHLLLEHHSIATPVKGTGDLLAALLLARRIHGHAWPKAAELAVASVFEILARTARAGADELLLPEFQDVLVQPSAEISVRRLGTGRTRKEPAG